VSQQYRVKAGCSIHTDTGVTLSEGTIFVPSPGELAGQAHALEPVTAQPVPALQNEPRKKAQAKPSRKSNSEDVEDGDA